MALILPHGVVDSLASASATGQAYRQSLGQKLQRVVAIAGSRMMYPQRCLDDLSVASPGADEYLFKIRSRRRAGDIPGGDNLALSDDPDRDADILDAAVSGREPVRHPFLERLQEG